MCSNFYLFNYCEIWESQIEEEMPLLLSLSLFLELPKEKLYIQSVSIALIDWFLGYLQMLKCSVECRMMNTNGKFD